ncbi:energy transducer TonB [Kordiimonas gwangyangensis]|uniref:energy transducer TonB n=1 Tax=Kordiimonas gwangyangensis TaxID=288022 RepID=UPI00138E0DAA|nr:energy transducer TonB [Kordiimonas gwangyangensis]
MHTSLPEPPSTLGDPTDPYQSLLQCTELMMPRKAARRKDPGHVRFSYDISADGAVSNLQVLSATPDDRYVEEATDALDSWKYQEFIQTGEASPAPAWWWTFIMANCRKAPIRTAAPMPRGTLHSKSCADA